MDEAALAKCFRESVESEFDAFLAQHGFRRTKSEGTDTGFSVTYRNGERYINIGGTLHPHDYPYFSWLAFGEGSDEFPESDWNATPLWRIVQEISPKDHAKEKNLYQIKPNLSPEEVRNSIRGILASCANHGISFLEGDLDLFHRVRSAQKKDRQPEETDEPDKKSSRLKKKSPK
jgi:hypothetical protein